MVRGTSQAVLLPVLAGIVLLAGPDAFAGPTSPIVSGSVADFTGNQSGGVRSGFDFSCPPIYTLNVYNLTTNIGPIADDVGIALVRAAAAGGLGPDDIIGWPLTAAKGGNGGAGGLGGEVIGPTLMGPTVNFTGGEFAIISSGIVAGGIHAKSGGGTGGAGGYANSVLWQAYGGTGGGGGGGTPATVTSNGGINVTGGFFAMGIWAESMGGTGGAGGATDSAEGAWGGAGGAGGLGGPVTVANYGDIQTGGVFSVGILAASQGGNGGAGGSAHTGGEAYGGKGGAGSDGTTVTVNNDGIIQATGATPIGIYASSAGGKGGAGGSAESAIYAKGGDGGPGGSGGRVGIENHGNITVTSTLAAGVTGPATAGIFGQSLGGAGGDGGFGGSVVGRGGGALGSGPGGEVGVGNTGDIQASGRDVHGIIAQSVGGFAGGGGDAGGAVSWGASPQSAGNGGNVLLTNSGSIQTLGARSEGLFAESVGGGGGAGGSSAGLYTFGSSGGAGGNGGTVTVNNSGNLATTGADSTAVFTQSLGGGGGSGGDIINATAFAGFSLGGKGGTGGSGAGVEVVSGPAAIGTQGDRSHGIMAQSLGGGGGVGGYAVTLTGGIGGSVSVAVGGAGGDGGDGSTVHVDSGSAITTQGMDAYGILAQSLGGGGGNGGFSIAGAGSDGVGVAASFGGTGGGGGDGKTVNVVSTGDIGTAGDRSIGVFAQSVGGGGGNGGFSIAGGGGGLGGGGLSLGGKGGTGGHGDTVTVDNSSDITTLGDQAYGLLAQSLGGGGGNGGFSIAAGGGGVGAGAVSVGGAGAIGGNGKNVLVTSSGAIDTSGDKAIGLFAQSVGGGGGNGGFTISGAGAGTGAGTVSIGGSGSGGGNSDSVRVQSESAITTRGENAHGLLAQSLGGGGGNGGFSLSLSGAGTGAGSISVGGFGAGGGSSKDVTVISSGAIDTSGDKAVGLFAQSVGGGGGNGGFSIAASGAGTGSGTFSLGGAGAQGGAGDVVVVESRSDITTRGAESHGLLAQSVGGGGGSGGFSISGAGAGTGAVAIGVGGFGGDGGNGKSVTVTSSGVIDTGGDNAVGVFAQSLGGGGGSGRFSIAGSGAGTGSATFSLGGAGGKGGQGDAVVVNSTSSIRTQGVESHGLQAQSIGGGGGNGGFSIAGSGAGTGSGTIGIGGFGDSGGDGKSVTVTSGGMIDTSGKGAIGLFAQSVGKGGGSGGFSISGAGAKSGAGTFNLGGFGSGGGNGDIVTVDSSTRIVTRGEDAFGMLVQSLGGGGGNGSFSVTGSGAQSGAGSIGIGGHAGEGGVGKSVTVVNSGMIDTYGDGATGLQAQSLGGGGGAGGFSIVGSGAQTGSGTFSLGGGGGAGGAGDAVVVDNSGDVTTRGTVAYGILAQSEGGGGGSGRFSFAGGVSTNGLALNAGVGGSGGLGGDGSTVALTNRGSVTTMSAGAHGILAQSLGGGGGAGGFSGVVSATAGADAKPTVAVSVGGSGGVAGDGQGVSLDNEGFVHTQGVASYGLFAQSVGGGGGDGGDSFSAALGKHAGGWNGSVSIGGLGGAAGTGGEVALHNAGAVVTEGIKSHGLVAQSVGGGGGTGGFSATGAVNIGSQAKDIAVSIGGTGGAGGDGNNVEVRNTGSITTQATVSGEIPGGPFEEAQDPLDAFGNGAMGILAQSIGGGGGSGGFSFAGAFTGSEARNVAVSVGGLGGAGGRGLAVNVVNEGIIETSGANSHGILAQSIGGGGGNGGQSYAADFGISDTTAGNWNFGLAIGGEGGVGNTAGAVTVVNRGNITTRGDSSHGILAQSIGGGGGNGGVSLTGTMSLELKLGEGQKTAQPLDISLAVGGAGGAGNSGGSVEVQNSGAIETYENDASGILAQSIGGGGGIGGNSRAFALDVNPADWIPKLTKDGLGAYLSDMVSTWYVAVGGKGGLASDGNAVTITNRGDITTHGDGSNGIFAQSVGGGGGMGGNASQGLPYVPAWAEPFLELTPIKGLEDMQIVVGGSDGGGGHGATVHVDNAADIMTSGANSNAIFAQSIGGGGGVAQLDVPDGPSGLGLVGKVGIGGAGGAAGNGGDVTVLHTGRIDTFGDAAYGIFAQSVGGGGGAAGDVSRGVFNFGLFGAFARPGGGGGDGGDVSVQSEGDIITRGNGANGIFAQSVGGGGGLAGDVGIGLGYAGSAGAAGSGGAVNVVHTGTITTLGGTSHGIVAQSAGGTDFGGPVNVQLHGAIAVSGEDSSGIVAHSRGDQGAGNIAVTISEGSMVQGGSGAGAGVDIHDGADNTLTNAGSVSALSGTAIVGGAGNDLVDNSGIVTGSVLLGTGANAFHNHVGGVFNSGAQINLGEGNVLTNDGILSPGGLGTIVDTTLVGDLVLSPSSVLQAQIDNRDHSDKLTVTGDLRLLGGAIRPLATETITGSHEYTVIAAGSIAESAIASGSPVLGTALLDAYIVVGPDQDPNTVRLVVTQMPFDDPHLARTENHGSLGGALQEIAAAGGNGVTNALQQLGTPEDVRHAYDQLSGQSRPPLAPVAVKGTSRFRGTVTDRVRGLQTGIVGGMFDSGPFAGNGPDSGIGSGPMYNAAVAGQSIAIGHGSPVLADSKWGLWGWGYGLFGNRRTEENATGYTYNTYGASVGLDYQFSERFLAGLVLGAADGKVDFANSRDNADFRALSVGLYDSLTSNRWYLDSIASYANLSYDTERFVDLTSERLQGDLNGYELAAYVEGGYNWNLSRHLLLQPLASLQYTYLHLDSYTETGGASALSYDDQTYESVMGSLGARLTQQLFESASGLRTDVQVRGRWVHEFGDNQSSVNTFFVNNPGAVFTIHDAAIARDSAWLGAGLSTEITRRLRAYVDYDALLNSDETVHVIGAALQYRW